MFLGKYQLKIVSDKTLAKNQENSYNYIVKAQKIKQKIYLVYGSNYL